MSSKIIVAPFSLAQRLAAEERNAIDAIDAATSRSAAAMREITLLWQEGERGAALAAARTTFANAAREERATREKCEPQRRKARARLDAVLRSLAPDVREAVEQTAYAGL